MPRMPRGWPELHRAASADQESRCQRQSRPAPELATPEVPCHTVPFDDATEPFAGMPARHKKEARGVGAFGVKVHMGGNCEGISGSKTNNILMLAGMRVPYTHVHSLIHLRASRDIANELTKQVLSASITDVAQHASRRQEEIDARAAHQAAPPSVLISPSKNLQLSPASAPAATATATTTTTTATTTTEPATHEAAPFIARLTKKTEPV
jgi:hypothetical protein